MQRGLDPDISSFMQFMKNELRAIVRRELSLLRALGASLRTPRRRALRRMPLPVKHPPDSLASLAHREDTALLPIEKTQ